VLPTYQSSDKDPLFKFHGWKANLRILEIEAIKTVAYVPTSHPFVERLIRREYLDQVPFWAATDLERKLSCFKGFYNRGPAHQGVGSAVPDPQLLVLARTRASLANYRWKSMLPVTKLPMAA
jgi:hypothetical protein